MKLTGFIGNDDLEIRDSRELSFKKDFNDRESGVKLNVDSLTLVNESYKSAYNHIYNTIGRFEGIPAQAQIDTTIINLFLDLKNITIGLDDIDIGIGVRKSDDHFFTNANLLTWELVRKKGFLPDSYIIDVPYLIVPDDLKQQQGMSIANLLMVGYQIAHILFEIQASVAAFADFVGTGLITAAIQLAALLIMLALVLFLFLQAVLGLQELYFPKLRLFKAVYDKDLIRQGCEALGYTLESTLMDVDLNKLSTMGSPEGVTGASTFQLTQNEQTAFFNKGYPTAQDSAVATLGDMIKFIEETFVAKAFVYNGVVKLERESYYVSAATTILDPTLTDQSEHDDSYKLDNRNIWGRMYDHWAIDFVDMHSPDTYDGMKSEYITEPIVVNEPDLVSLIGLEENAAPFALAARKNGYTRVELLIRSFINDYLYNAIAQTSGSPAGSTISDRDGVMMISQQYFKIPKKLWLNIVPFGVDTVGKQPVNYKDILSMDNIFNQFKTGLRVINNNYKIKTMTVPFTPVQFTSILMNNYMIYNPDNSVVKLDSIEYFPEQHKAEITILLPDSSAFNTKTTKLA